MISSILSLLLLSFLPFASDACTWRFCSDINGGGPCYDYGVGQYASLGAQYKYYSSAYRVSGYWLECVALVYHDPNYGRYERMLTDNVLNFHDIRFNDAMASVQIVSTTCGAAQFFTHNLPHSYYCANCPRGTTKDQSTCTIGGTCSNSGSECHSCTPGYYSPWAGGGCLLCPVGTFQSGYGAHSCQSCTLGTYQNGRGSTACKLCPAGTKGLRNYATSYNDGCGSCPAGTFQRNLGQGYCDNCAPGSVSAGGAAECSICPSGTKASANAASCESCPAGSFSQNGQTACHNCAPGSVSAGGAAECSICPPGTKADANAASCESCPAGSFQSQTGQTTCELCPEGTFQPTDGESSCIPCAAGEVSFPGSTECIPCPEGTFPDETSGSCQPCHDNLIGFEGKCYGTMDFRNCPYNSEVGECEFDSQDESFELLPGCQIAKLTDDVMTNIILPEEHQFGARNIATEWNIEVGLCRATNSNEHGGFCVHNDKDSLEACQLDCSETTGCAATGFYDGSWCDLFFHSASAPSTCPDGYISYTGSTPSESYAGAPHTNYPNAQCAIKVQPADFARGTCMPSGQYELAECCPAGYTQIDSEADCQSALEYLGSGNEFWGGTGNWSSRPTGCFRHTANDAFHYNPTNVIGSSVVGDDEIICKHVVTSTSLLESNITFTSSTFNASNSTIAPSVAPTTKDDGKVLIECKVGNIVPTASPTVNPTVEPTANPTFNPTSNPSEIPSQNPSVQPSFAPSLAPTFTEPSVSPTVAPTTSTPTNGPTAEPTANPTFNPTSNPSAFPSQNPSVQPSSAPSLAPTFTEPSVSPTATPTTSNPTVEPTAAPSFTAPTNVPSSTPTTSIPSSTPTTSIPSSNPTTSNPTISPTNPPSAVEVVEVAESKDGGNFLILLFVGVGCTICCIGCVYFKPFFVRKADSEENGKRTPGQMELGKPVSPLVDINDALDEMWTKPSVEIKIAE